MATAVDELLDMLFDMIDEAKNAAFSGEKCVIDRDKALDLIEDAKKQLPVDLAEARKILSARNEYIATAKREAEEIRKRAEIEANQMVSEAPVMSQARQKAREIMAQAEEDAKRARREARRAVRPTGAGTWAQQAIQLQREQMKTQRKADSRARREAEQERKFALRQEKRRKKHRGH